MVAAQPLRLASFGGSGRAMTRPAAAAQLPPRPLQRAISLQHNLCLGRSSSSSSSRLRSASGEAQAAVSDGGGSGGSSAGDPGAGVADQEPEPGQRGSWTVLLWRAIAVLVNVAETDIFKYGVAGGTAILSICTGLWAVTRVPGDFYVGDYGQEPPTGKNLLLVQEDRAAIMDAVKVVGRSVDKLEGDVKRLSDQLDRFGDQVDKGDDRLRWTQIATAMLGALIVAEIFGKGGDHLKL